VPELNEYRCKQNRPTVMKTLFLAGLLATLMSSAVYATGGGGCTSAISTNAKLHLVTIKGMNNMTCDRPNISAAIAGLPADNSNWTVLLTGSFLFDGNLVNVNRSNLLITGVPFLGTKIQGLVQGPSDPNPGAPKLDSFGPTRATYALFNRAFNVVPNASGLVQNVTVSNLHFSGFARTVNLISEGGPSTLCKDSPPPGSVLKNINVVFNTVDNSERSPEIFGDVENSQITFNDLKSGAGVFIVGGNTGCFPLVGATVITPTTQRPAGTVFAFTGGSNSVLLAPLTPNSSGICNNGSTIPGFTHQQPAVNGVCPVCAQDVSTAFGGEVGNRCSSIDTITGGTTTNISIIGNKMVADENLLPLPTLGFVGAMDIDGLNANLRIAFNDMSAGNTCIEIDSQRPLPPTILPGTSSPLDIGYNYFHGCGASAAVNGLRQGAIMVGANWDYDAGSITVSPALSFTTGVNVHNNLYSNNKANFAETINPVFFLGETITDSTPGYQVVNRDIWLGQEVSYGNTVNENCSVKVYNQGAGSTFDQGGLILPPNMIKLQCDDNNQDH